MLIATLIVTKQVEFLKETLESAKNPFVICDHQTDILNETPCLIAGFERISTIRNLGVSKLKDYKFIQFLECGDILHKNYFENIEVCIKNNSDFDLFFTDYELQDDFFNFTNREFLTSITNETVRTVNHKVKNPLIRTSIFDKIKFDETLSCYEFIDLIYQIKQSKIFHIPYALQTIRKHPKSNENLVSSKDRDEALKIISGRLNG